LPSSFDLGSLMELIIAQLGHDKQKSDEDISINSSGRGDNKINKVKKPALSPQKVLVILGLLGGVLEVDSILVDRDQIIQIRLNGSLRRKTRLDKMLDEIGDMPFDDVLKSILRRG